MIRVTHLSEDGQSLITGDERLLDHPGLKWVDVEGPTEAVLMPLAERFGLHRLAVEDCLHLDQRPKLEEYPNHLFIVLHAFSAVQGDPANLTMHELHFLLGKDFVITVHEHPNEAIGDAFRRLQAD
ncbi:MAG: CorA family divalent cation transporter, partial [Myxococcaceae bacterium]